MGRGLMASQRSHFSKPSVTCRELFLCEGFGTEECVQTFLGSSFFLYLSKIITQSIQSTSMFLTEVTPLTLCTLHSAQDDLLALFCKCFGNVKT